MEAWVYNPSYLGLEKQLTRKASALQQRGGVRETKIYIAIFTTSWKVWELQAPQRTIKPEMEMKDRFSKQHTGLPIRGIPSIQASTYQEMVRAG